MTSHTLIDFYVVGSLVVFDPTALITTKIGAEIDPQTFCTHQH